MLAASPTRPNWTMRNPAPWHRGRPELLTAAMAEAAEAAPHLRGLAERCLPRLPRRPMASQTIRAITQHRYSTPLDLDAALTCPWMSQDAEEARNVLAYDIDHDRGIALCEALRRRGAPVPDLVIDPWSGRSHAILPLVTPVLCGPDARLGPQLLADLADRLMARALQATALPRGALLKSPWGQTRHLIGARLRRTPQPTCQAVWDAHEAANTGLMWHTIPGTGPAELRAVIAALAEEADADESGAGTPPARRSWTAGPLPRRRQRPEPSAEGRNSSLFDTLRFWAYDRAERDGGAILAEGLRQNARFPHPLPPSEVSGTARSIARFMAERFRPRAGPGRVRRGRDADTARHPLVIRRGIAGERSAAARADKTDGRIRQAVAQLAAAGTTLSQRALAAATGLSLRTIKGRWHRPGLVQDGVLSGGAEGSEAGGCLPGGDRKAETPTRSSASTVAGHPPARQDTLDGRCVMASSVPSTTRVAQDWVRAGRPARRSSLLPSPPRVPGWTLAAYQGRLLAIQATVAELVAVAARAAMRGSEPPLLPSVDIAVADAAPVAKAWQVASLAIDDSMRRATGRERLRVAARWQAELRAAAADPRRGWRWWRLQVAMREEHWEAREQAAMLEGALPHVLGSLRTQRGWDLGRLWRQWRQAWRETAMTRQAGSQGVSV